ncbi:MAG: hypothetical protein ACR2NU_13125, partial [Aeoliella sp.]
MFRSVVWILPFVYVLSFFTTVSTAFADYQLIELFTENDGDFNWQPAINNNGRVAVADFRFGDQILVRDVSGGPIIELDVTESAVEGGPTVPTGMNSSFSQNIAINDSGVVAFTARTQKIFAGGGGEIGEGVFTVNSNTGARTTWVTSQDDAVPDQPTFEYGDIDDVDINNSGKLGFSARLDDVLPGREDGLFFVNAPGQISTVFTEISTTNRLSETFFNLQEDNSLTFLTGVQADSDSQLQNLQAGDELN